MVNKYKVWVTRDITESALVEIEANSAEEAKELAYENRWDYDYETNDYVGEYWINVEGEQ